MGFSSSQGQTQSQQQSQQQSSSNATSNSDTTSGSNSSSSSSNQAYPGLVTSLQPTITNGGNASNAISNLLGTNGDAAQTAGFDNFRNSGGYNFIRDQGIHGIDASDASKGLLNSGSAIKATQDYSSNLATQWLSSYLSGLSTQSQQGIGAASTLSGAGGISNSNSSSTSNTKSNSTSSSIGTGNSTGSSNGSNSSTSLQTGG